LKHGEAVNEQQAVEEAVEVNWLLAVGIEVRMGRACMLFFEWNRQDACR